MFSFKLWLAVPCFMFIKFLCVLHKIYEKFGAFGVFPHIVQHYYPPMGDQTTIVAMENYIKGKYFHIFKFFPAISGRLKICATALRQNSLHVTIF